MDAIDNCKVQFGGSGKLFEPMDQITNDAVYLAFPNLHQRWIGIYTLPDPAPREFHYVSKEPSTPLAFNGWHVGEPNDHGEEDCAFMYNLKWFDTNCKKILPSICQMEKQGKRVFQIQLRKMNISQFAILLKLK